MSNEKLKIPVKSRQTKIARLPKLDHQAKAQGKQGQQIDKSPMTGQSEIAALRIHCKAKTMPDSYGQNSIFFPEKPATDKPYQHRWEKKQAMTQVK